MNIKSCYLVVLFLVGTIGVFAQNSFGPKMSSSNSNSKTRSDFGPLPISQLRKTKSKMADSRERVDNSEKIRECEIAIQELEQSKQECYSCFGTSVIKANCYMCSGWGYTGYGKYRHVCIRCHGTGTRKEKCPNCLKIDLSIAFQNTLIEEYKKTHGMTKEARNFYYNHKHKMQQMDIEYQNSVNSKYDSYKTTVSCSTCDGTGQEKVYISNSTASSDKYYCSQCDSWDYTKHIHQTCSVCHGTGKY